MIFKKTSFSSSRCHFVWHIGFKIYQTFHNLVIRGKIYMDLPKHCQFIKDYPPYSEAEQKANWSFKLLGSCWNLIESGFLRMSLKETGEKWTIESTIPLKPFWKPCNILENWMCFISVSILCFLVHLQVYHRRRCEIREWLE